MTVQLYAHWQADFKMKILIGFFFLPTAMSRYISFKWILHILAAWSPLSVPMIDRKMKHKETKGKNVKGNHF